jgi:hypothetical protein
MGWLVDVVFDLGFEHGLILVLVMGLMFAFFVVWRLSAFTRALNVVEHRINDRTDDIKGDITKLNKSVGVCEGEVLTLKQMIFRKK